MSASFMSMSCMLWTGVQNNGTSGRKEENMQISDPMFSTVTGGVMCRGGEPGLWVSPVAKGVAGASVGARRQRRGPAGGSLSSRAKARSRTPGPTPGTARPFCCKKSPPPPMYRCLRSPETLPSSYQWVSIFHAPGVALPLCSVPCLRTTSQGKVIGINDI